MKFYPWFSLFMLITLAGCNKEAPAPASTTPTPEETVILKQQMDTLHKAEELNQAISDKTLEQRKQIDAATH